MNGAELDRFGERVQHLARRGISAEAAETMVDCLVILDREEYDRRTCLECHVYRPGRCGNHRCAGLNAPDVGRDLATLLQCCPDFLPSR
ncbi:MAG: hypothetical protein E6Q99_07020 [Elusimicrobia bacterium]|nr:MAG: hypothetical protein E6Q99_07020 [Elusimicrobiota bacterium]